MDCLEVRDNLVAAIDGELEPEVAKRVDEHLAGCSECRDERNRLSRSMNLATAWVPDAPDVLPDIRAALDRELLVSMAEQIAALTSEVKALRAEIATLRSEPVNSRPVVPLRASAYGGPTEFERFVMLNETSVSACRNIVSTTVKEDPWNLAIS